MKFNLFQKLRAPFRQRGIILLLFFVISLIFIPQEVYAVDIGKYVAEGVGFLVSVLVGLVGKLITVVIKVMVQVVQYNDFISSPAVSKGWIIIRDLFNMFFVVILLVIAFSAVLKIERYPYKRMLSAFLIAAVLVNFSKLICGVLIDFSQILMLTFVNAFKDVGGGNFADMLGLRQIMSMGDVEASEIGPWNIVITMLLALIMALVALVVMIVVTLIFVFRIVGIWFLVVLSPLAFMASVLPSTQSYARQWWQKFTNYLIVGPALAFFIWLSLAVVQESKGEQSLLKAEGELGAALSMAGKEVTVGASQIGQPQYFLNFIIGIAMLIGSLMVAKQLGVAGAGLAAKAIGKMQAVATGAAKFGFKVGKSPLKLAAEAAEKKFKVPLTMETFKAVREQRKSEKERRRREVREEVGEKWGMGLDKAMDPGVWTKKFADTIKGSKKKIKQKSEQKQGVDKKIEDNNADIEARQGKIQQLQQVTALNLEYNLAEQFKKGGDIDWKKMKKEEADVLKEYLKGMMRLAGEEKNLSKEETEDRYNIDTDTGRMNLAAYMFEKTDTAPEQIGGLKKEIDDLQTENEPLITQSRELADEIFTIKTKPGLGIRERSRSEEGLVARKRVYDRQQELLSTTGGREEDLIRELKKAIITKEGDKATAALELLAKFNGFNGMMLDPMIQKRAREALTKRAGEQGWDKEKALEYFDKNPVSFAGVQTVLHDIFKNVAKVSDLEAAKSMSRIGAIGGEAGNASIVPLAYVDNLTGNPEMGRIEQKDDGSLDMDSKTTARVVAYKMRQKNARTLYGTMHSDSLVTEDQQGRGHNLHAGGKEFLNGVTEKELYHMRYMRPDTIGRLSEDHVIQQINDHADAIERGEVAGVAKGQAYIIRQFTNNLQKGSGPEIEMMQDIRQAATSKQNMVNLIKKQKEIVPYIPPELLKKQHVAEAVAQPENIKDIGRMHRVNRQALLQGLGNMLGGFVSELKDIDFLKGIKPDDLSKKTIAQIAQGFITNENMVENKYEHINNFYKDEENKPLAEKIVIEMVNQAEEKDREAGTNEAEQRILPLTDQSWVKDLIERQKAGGEEAGEQEAGEEEAGEEEAGEEEAGEEEA